MMTASERAKFLDDISDGLIREETTHIEKEKTVKAEKNREAQMDLLERIKAVGRTDDLILILEAEKTILIGEQRAYGNSPSMKGSLKAGIKEMTATKELIAVVQDPVVYKAVNKSHALPRSRTEGVPRDEARKSLSSHNTRLLNIDKSPLTETKKLTIKARRSNLRRAEKLYTAMQHQALGTTPPEKSRKRGLER